MSVLSDRGIKYALNAGTIDIMPLDKGDIQPVSVDLHLGSMIREFDNSKATVLDPYHPVDITVLVTIDQHEPYILHPGEFILGHTLEIVRIGSKYLGMLNGKSSLGRIGLMIHATAGLVDAAWNGRLTLELSNIAKLPIALYAGMPIGQISFFQLTTNVDRPYGSVSLGSKYQGDMSVSSAKFGPVTEQEWK